MELVLSVGLKGGVGKTTTAIEVARSLARKGIAPGILDLDYRTPNVLIALDREDASLGRTFTGDVMIPPILDGIKVFSMSYIWPPAKCVTVDDKDAMEDVLHLLEPGVLDWSGVEYLMVDTPPTSVGVVDVALEAADVKGAVIVTHASRVAIADTLRTIDLFAERRVPIIGLLCNQSEDAAKVQRYDMTPADVKHVADGYGIPYLGSVPHSRTRSLIETAYDAVTDRVLSDESVTLEINEPEDGTWKKLVSLTKKLSGGSTIT